MTDARKRGARRDFSQEEVSRAISHLRARVPEVVSMMERRELGQLTVSRDEWIEQIFRLVPILHELGMTQTLAETNRLLFFIRKEIRIRLDLPV
jgi:hypothetical protein